MPDEDDTARASGDPVWPVVDKSSMYEHPQAPWSPPAYGQQYGQPQYRPAEPPAGAAPRSGKNRALVLLVALAVVLLVADVALLALWLLDR
ncbi:MAG TPA: hypothetical protein VHK64_02010 [Nocardioidaceae bacterium]|nr:hypothetical protein [Nocardioidaceae bacterium]